MCIRVYAFVCNDQGVGALSMREMRKEDYTSGGGFCEGNEYEDPNRKGKYSTLMKVNGWVYNLNQCLALCTENACSRRDYESCIIGQLQVRLIIEMESDAHTTHIRQTRRRARPFPEFSQA